MIDYEPGRVVKRREILDGRVWMEHPVRVVADADGILAVRLDPGSPFTFPEHPFGQHPWSNYGAWSGTTVLQLHRDGDAYAVWKIFESDGTFRHWYINFEAPVIRGPGRFDVDDHGLDLIVGPDGSRTWKDVEDLHHQRTEGRIDLETVGTVLAAAASVSTLLDTGERWWNPWDSWTP